MRRPCKCCVSGALLDFEDLVTFGTFQVYITCFMKQALLGCAVLFLLSVASKAQETVGAPYNPDSNADSLINALDVLSIIPLYGQEFLPSQDDLDSTNEIQSLYISNDTLYLVPGGGFILLGDIAPPVDYDSLVTTLSVDSTFLAQVGDLGGGCSYQFPESQFGDVVYHDFSEGDYTVPEGYNLSITNINMDSGELRVDDFPVASGQLGIAYFLMQPVLAGENQVVSKQSGSGASSFFGTLSEVEVSPVTIDLSNENYQVPEGKKLIVLNAYLDNGRVLEINGIEVVKGQLGQAYFLTSPFVASAGFILDEPSSDEATVNGYLIDADFFDDCGGGSSGGAGNGLLFTIDGF